MRRTKTIQSNLFLTYSMIIITVLAICVLFFYVWMSNLLRERAFETVANLSSSISDNLDFEIQKINYVSMNVLYSSAVKNRFRKYISEPDKTADDDNQEKSAYINNTKELIDILFAIIGPNRPVQQIYLYDFNGKVFGTGTDNRQQDISMEEKPWFNEVLNNNGGKYISIPMKDEELSKFATQSGSPYFISLCRVYFDNYNVPQGIVEVKQYYHEIFTGIDRSILSSADEARIYVYDDTGTTIYPLKETPAEEDSYYFSLRSSIPGRIFSITAHNPFSNEKELLYYNYSEYTGWMTVAVISENKLLSPVLAFTRTVVLVTFVILFLALLFSFFAAKKITVPIARLHKAIKTFNLESPIASAPAKLTSDLNELEDLNQSFHHMHIKLRRSHDELMLSQQHEMQAKMLALQSQMNPHFLYNTLATISVMAEEFMDEQIVEMCDNVSDMLRYISSDKSPLVNLITEIEYTRKYLSCMKLRHGSKLSYSIEIDDNMKALTIPKLVIQPLVENALKHSVHIKPPWNISIYGYRTNTSWQISVQDNGPGFDLQKRDTILEAVEEIDTKGLLPSLELEGMGLMNIYMRLKLSYKDKMIFSIGENICGGAIVTIGGSV